MTSFKQRLILATGVLCMAATTSLRSEDASGVVYEDLNGNGRRDSAEPGIAGVRVSNQREIAVTDAEGAWTLPATDDTVFFVIKPQNWSAPLNEDNLPQFYYIHKPEGSPQTRFPGVEPTGPLPESIDFPLRWTPEPESFEIVLFGDPQPRNRREVEYITHDVVEDLIGTEAKFGVTLGDIVFDDLSVFEPLNGAIALIGIPWYNVIGNHDINFDTPNDQWSDETFTRVYGPNYYSFDYGPVHFVVLDDVYWEGARPQGGGRYHAELGDAQLAFIEADLAGVPEEKLVVLMMHIPITGIQDRDALYRIIESRPYSLSVSGHTHWQAHQLLRKEDGWLAPTPHHHIVNVTVSGSWWGGMPDEFGIPHTLMRDGAPNGYTRLAFDGHRVQSHFQAARAPSDFQISIHAPDRVERQALANTDIYANVFNGWERSEVAYQLDGQGPWIPMTQVAERDPYYLAVREREADRIPDGYRGLPNPVISGHLWKAGLVEDLLSGVHRISVRATDVNGTTFRAERLIFVD